MRMARLLLQPSIRARRVPATFLQNQVHTTKRQSRFVGSYEQRVMAHDQKETQRQHNRERNVVLTRAGCTTAARAAIHAFFFIFNVLRVLRVPIETRVTFSVLISNLSCTLGFIFTILARGSTFPLCVLCCATLTANH